MDIHYLQLGDKLFAGQSELFSIIGMTALLLLVGELTPKRIAVNHSRAFIRFTAVPMYYLHLLLRLILYLFVQTRIQFLSTFGAETMGKLGIRSF